MISDDGQPILMDFGSAMKARVKIENRSQALLQQVSLISLCSYSLKLRYSRRTLRQSRARWPIVRRNYSTSKRVSPLMRKLTSGYVLYILPSIATTPCSPVLQHVAVAWLHALCTCLFSFSFRNLADDGARWLNSHGGHGCTVQAPSIRIFARLEGPH